MRVNFGAKPYTYPQPVFIIGAYDENNVPNAMNAAWGAISDYNQISICLGDDRKTLANIKVKKAFSVSMGTANYVSECDYLGIVSGNKVKNKIEKVNFHAFKAEFVDAPLFEELPFAVECEFISYNEDTGILLGKIINVSADESIMVDGKVDVSKLKPICFDPCNNAYVVLGEKVGNAFKDGLKIK